MFFAAKYFKPTTSTLMAFTLSAVAVAPLITSNPAAAQLFPSQSRTTRPDSVYNPSQIVIPAGAQIPVEYDEAEKILVTKEETAPLTLRVAANVKNRQRLTLIPYGSEIVGQIEPATGGSRFVAQELIFPDGTTQFISATSGVVSRTETIERGADTGDILTGAAIGAAAATVVSAILGDVDFVEVLGGAGLGALGGWVFGGKQAELISIDPNRDLDITLQSDLALR